MIETVCERTPQEVFAEVRKHLHIKGYSGDDIRTVFRKCHAWMAKQQSHRFTGQLIDYEFNRHLGTGWLPPCVYQYYLQVVKPADASRRVL